MSSSSRQLNALFVRRNPTEELANVDPKRGKHPTLSKNSPLWMVIVYVVVVIRGTDQKTFKSVPMSKAGSTMLKNKNLLTPIKLVDKLRVLGSNFRTFQTPVLH